MKKIICVFILLGIFTGAAFSQVEAESLCAGTPLECTVELLKAENDLSHRDDELTRVSNDLWYSGRKREAVQIIDLFDEDDGRDKLMLLIDYAEKSLQEGDIDKSAELLVRAFEFREDFDDLDDFIIKTFAFSLVAAGQEAKIGELLESIESEHEKVLSLIE